VLCEITEKDGLFIPVDVGVIVCKWDGYQGGV
jgi:hypothetical protein